MDMIAFFLSLAIPLRDTSRVFSALFTAIAREFEALYRYTAGLVKEAFPKFSGPVALHLWGRERGVINIKGESSADYAKRVERAFDFLSTASTKDGIIALVRQFTPKPFELRELYSDNWILGGAGEGLGDNTLLGWTGSYQFNLVFAQSLTIGERDYIAQLVELYKPAHVVFKIIAQIADDWLLGAEGELLGISTYLQ